MKQLEFGHVNKIYHTGTRETYAKKDVSFSVRQGEFTVILGPSGAGKSTILNILGGIDTADGGTVIVSGQDITGLGERELSRYRAEKVGFVFQFYNLIPTLTVSENVALMGELKINFLTSCQGESSRGFPSPGRLPRIRRFFCVMNPPGLWTVRQAAWCWSSCGGSAGKIRKQH